MINTRQNTKIKTLQKTLLGSKVNLSPEIRAYVSGLTTPLSTDQVNNLDTFVKTVKTGLGISALSDAFDVLRITANETAEAGLRNLAKRAHDATAVNSPEFTQHAGFKGDGVSAYIDENYNPSINAVKYGLNSASIGVYSQTNSVGDKIDIGARVSFGNDMVYLSSRYTGDVFVSRINQDSTSGGTTTNMNSTGLYIASRDSEGNTVCYKNGGAVVTSSQLSDNVPNLNIFSLALNAGGTPQSYSDRQLSMTLIGKSLDAQEVVVITNAFEAYMEKVNYFIELNKVCPSIVPSLSEEKVVNGNFEAGEPPATWQYINATGSSFLEERTGGLGTKSLKLQRGVGQPISGIAREFGWPSIHGQWWQVEMWAKNIDASGGFSVGVRNTIQGEPYNNTTEWYNYKATRFQYSFDTSARLDLKSYCETEMQSVLFDDVSFKEITFSSMLSLIGNSTTKDGAWYCNPSVQDETQAGILLNYKDENNFIMAVVDRTANATGDVDRAILIKRVAGTYSEIISETISYQDNAELRIFADGNSYMMLYDGLKVGVVEVADDVFGFDIYGFNSCVGNEVGTVVKIKQTAISFPLLTNTTLSSALSIIPIAMIGSVVYGRHITNGADLYKSVDYGDNWTLVQATLTSTIRELILLSDGEVLLATSDNIYKSSGWTTDQTTATWNLKLTFTPGAYPIADSIDVSGDKIIVSEYAVSPRDPSKKVWVSINRGETFSEILNLDVLYPGEEANVHWHCAAIDHVSGRMWLSIGDSIHVMKYSDDNGQSWVDYSNDVLQPTTMKSSNYGLVCGSDHIPVGIFTVLRADGKTVYLNKDEWDEWGYATESCRSSNGIVYTAFRSNGDGLTKAPIYASNGRFGNAVYELPFANGKEINRLFTDNYKIIGVASDGTNSFLFKGDI